MSFRFLGLRVAHSLGCYFPCIRRRKPHWSDPTPPTGVHLVALAASVPMLFVPSGFPLPTFEPTNGACTVQKLLSQNAQVWVCSSAYYFYCISFIQRTCEQQPLYEKNCAIMPCVLLRPRFPELRDEDACRLLKQQSLTKPLKESTGPSILNGSLA